MILQVSYILISIEYNLQQKQLAVRVLNRQMSLEAGLRHRHAKNFGCDSLGTICVHRQLSCIVQKSSAYLDTRWRLQKVELVVVGAKASE